MKTLALLAQKGGAGKTTLALHLAVLAQQAGRRVILADCDPQRSAAGWWRRRQEDTPHLAETTAAKLRDLIAAAKGDSVDLLVVDTRPSVERDTAAVAAAADMVLIPTRPAILDLEAIGATVEVVKAAKAKAAIVLNSCPPGRGVADAGLTTEARKAVSVYGLPVAPVAVAQRAALAHALIGGQAVTEFEPEGKAALELRRLWKWIEGQLR